MRCEGSKSRNGSASLRVLGRIVCIVLPFTTLPHSSGYAQSSSQSQMPFAGSTSTSELSKKARLKTYYGGVIPKDGYVIVPIKPDKMNFLECDLTLISVDEKKLQDSKYPDCSIGKNDPGLIKGYIKAIGTNGDVDIETLFGDKTIEKTKWDNLVKTFYTSPGTEGKASDFSAGDFAAFQKNDKGNFATIFKLAPSSTGGGN
jgi:hypothetical protein